ncbi:MAG: hypothetical protein AB8H47_08485 [Bacteroidia bacterium]
MKLRSLLYPLMAMGLLLTIACQPQLVRPEGDHISPLATADLCQHPATVMENECGLYLELENGHKIFVRDSKSVELTAGMKLEIGYSIEESSSNHSSGSCGSSSCSNGSCSSSSSSDQADALETCMKSAGIKEGKLSCISVVSEDETTG